MLSELTTEIQKSCALHCPKNEHVLVLQDTSEVNYHAHNGRFKVNDPHLGVLSNNISTGLLAHAGLAVSASTELPIGLSYIEINHRPFDRTPVTSHQREQLPLKDKESYRWLQTVEQSRKCLSDASQVTVIGDRESDIYELFACRADSQTHILVRNYNDRKTASGKKISNHFDEKQWEGEKVVTLVGNQHRPTRQATLQFRWTELNLAPPDKRKKLLQDYPMVNLWGVEVMEIPASVPEGEEGIHWRLLTTHPVVDLEMANQITHWYSLRWLIEELFRILKQGLNVEKSQFETGIALKKLLTLSLHASWKILLMKQNRLNTHQLDADICFSAQQIQCLQALQPGLQGKTNKQQNPFKVDSLAWAAWLIARLGGWKPAPLDKRPFGVVSLARGMQVFQNQFNGWLVAMNMKNSNTFPT